MRGTAQPWRGAGAGGRYANIVRNFHVKNLQSGGGQAEPCHNSFPRLSTSSTTPSARGPWWWWRCAGWRLETVEITPGPGPARPVTHIQAVTQSRGNAALHSTVAAAACKEGTLLIAPSFKEIFPNPEFSVRAAVGCGCGGRISCAAQCRVWRRTVVKVESDSEQAVGPGPVRTRSQARCRYCVDTVNTVDTQAEAGQPYRGSLNVEYSEIFL